MRILVIADIHNDIENILHYMDKASTFDYDVVVCPGDFTDVPPKGFTQEEIGLIILEELRALGKPLLALPGNWDDKLIPILEKDGVSVHGRGVIIDGVGFYGFGGSKTPFGTSYEPEEEDIRAGLENSLKDVEGADIKIQVTHAPPINTKLDLVSSGAHVGSEVVRDFIEKVGPSAAICAHIHEGRGVDVIGHTKIVNPGRFPEGYCGIIEMGPDTVDAKVVSLI